MRRLIAVSIVTCFACGGGGESGSAGGAATSGAATGGGTAAAAPLGTGSISGVVNFVGAAPANPPLDMSEESACAAKHAGGVTDPVAVVTDGKLANVFVRVTAGLPAGPYPPRSSAAVVDQDGCLYTPRVLGVMVGQDLEIKNSDPLLHNIKATPTENRGFNISQPRVMSTTRSFTAPEVMVHLQCSVHGWMKGYVGVVEHPYFATSNMSGSFTISGLPAGTYTLEAWHETLGTKTVQVTVSDGAAATAEFTYGG